MHDGTESRHVTGCRRWMPWILVLTIAGPLLGAAVGWDWRAPSAPAMPPCYPPGLERVPCAQALLRMALVYVQSRGRRRAVVGGVELLGHRVHAGAVVVRASRQRRRQLDRCRVGTRREERNDRVSKSALKRHRHGLDTAGAGRGQITLRLVNTAAAPYMAISCRGADVTSQPRSTAVITAAALHSICGRWQKRPPINVNIIMRRRSCNNSGAVRRKSGTEHKRTDL